MVFNQEQVCVLANKGVLGTGSELFVLSDVYQCLVEGPAEFVSARNEQESLTPPLN